ncbi:hypothetical protein M758_UG292600 [Ceratodon purpureus]|nr:hypothetical protein M758_UG292600 [Ceratodon purpureus]
MKSVGLEHLPGFSLLSCRQFSAVRLCCLDALTNEVCRSDWPLCLPMMLEMPRSAELVGMCAGGVGLRHSTRSFGSLAWMVSRGVTEGAVRVTKGQEPRLP